MVGRTSRSPSLVCMIQSNIKNIKSAADPMFTNRQRVHLSFLKVSRDNLGKLVELNSNIFDSLNLYEIWREPVPKCLCLHSQQEATPLVAHPVV